MKKLLALLKKTNWFKLSETTILLIGYLILLWMLSFGFRMLWTIWEGIIG
jgi:hypothetical protein